VSTNIQYWQGALPTKEQREYCDTMRKPLIDALVLASKEESKEWHRKYSTMTAQEKSTYRANIPPSKKLSTDDHSTYRIMMDDFLLLPNSTSEMHRVKWEIVGYLLEAQG
jgi:hypothetical protein